MVVRRATVLPSSASTTDHQHANAKRLQQGQRVVALAASLCNSFCNPFPPLPLHENTPGKPECPHHTGHHTGHLWIGKLEASPPPPEKQLGQCSLTLTTWITRAVLSGLQPLQPISPLAFGEILRRARGRAGPLGHCRGPLKCGVRVVGTVVSTTRCLAVTIRSRRMCPHGTRCADPVPLVANKRRSGLGALLVVHGVCTGEGRPMGHAVSTRCARVHPSRSPTQENIYGTGTNPALTYRKTAAICPEPRPVAPPAPRQTKKGWGKELLRPDSCAFSWPSVHT